MFNREIQGMLKDTLNYIENNITKKITLEQLSQHSYLSKFHLHRLLRQALGMPIIDYIRARKLTASLDPLFSQNITVLEIGLMFGFEHEQSYIRAFKNQFGITPTEFRKRPVDVSLTERIDLSGIFIVDDGLLCKPVIRYRQEMLVAGKLYPIDLEENLHHQTANSAGNEFYYQVRHRINHKVNETTYIGLTRYHWDNGVFATTYLPSVQVKSSMDLPQDLEADKIPRSKYAVYTYIGGFHPRNLTINHLEQIWSNIKSGIYINQSEPFHFEEINERIATENYCEVNIYIPVTSKKSHAYDRELWESSSQDQNCLSYR